MLGNLNRLIAIDKKSTHIFTAFLRHQRRDLCPLFRLRDCTYNLKSSCICFKIPLLGTKTKHKLVDDFGPPLATQLMLQSICLTCCCTKDYHRIPTHATHLLRFPVQLYVRSAPVDNIVRAVIQQYKSKILWEGINACPLCRRFNGKRN